ncbi:helix-turn-helix transcriptional regulator [Cellulomonas alba]|uniref:LuxR C-terminal-related transcriptional regulator n=1 Tax=Cellulomonas alba TaxID=3053467 RepID=A0ABT7SH58_9CELL|nr:LuxR family transcriptional regulator [Cellulomonas alba]MDM7855535.1 LuxR C-terminal-related transcriptional regulator [Cellulomonas alba]
MSVSRTAEDRRQGARDPVVRRDARGAGPVPRRDAAGAPHLRRGTVDRTALVGALMSAPASVVTIVAPPGYGKTTVLVQWATRAGQPVAWVSCDLVGQDPASLWSAMVGALGRFAPPGWAAPDLLARTGGDVASVPALVSALAELDDGVMLVLDHAEAITGPECWASLAELALRLPAGWRVAFASRDRLPLPLSRLRMGGELLELGIAELALTTAEARELVANAGVELDDDRAAELVRETEGWPAGVYLASLALGAGEPASGSTFTGDDRLMREYLRAELLPRMSARERDFLMRTSVLERLSGPSCDAVLETTGSADTLEALESRNLLVVPLDRRGEWYRCHHLLRDLMQSELRHADAGVELALHRRAEAWFAAHDQPGPAIAHAQAAGDADRAAVLVLEAMQPTWASGRIETVRGWLEWLSRHPPTELYPAIAAHGALIFALLGSSGEAERWIAAAESMPATGVLPDGSSQAATLAYMRANLAREGLVGIERDVALALGGLAPESPYRATMLHSAGLVHLLGGELAAAETDFGDAVALAGAAGAQPLVALGHAEQHLVARGLRDRTAADMHLEAALVAVEEARLDHFWTSALVLAAASRAAAAAGRVPEARALARRAARLRPLLTHVLPVVSVQALLELAHASLDLVDPAGARASLDQARRILVRRPGLGRLRDDAAELAARLGRITQADAAGFTSLTAAELRLVPLMSTHLSFPQIAEQLHVSRHTVKTQVTAVYRKLGVSSRRDAVDRIEALGIA